MLNLKETLAYKLVNTTGNELCGIPANDSKVILFNSTYFNSIELGVLINAISSEEMLVFDHNNIQIQSNYATTIIGDLYMEATKLADEIRAASLISSNYANTVKVSWNISHANRIISLVRSDMISYGLTPYGVNPLQMASKLSPLVALIQIGMYVESVMLMSTIELDGFLTAERVQTYASMLLSANAIDD